MRCPQFVQGLFQAARGFRSYLGGLGILGLDEHVADGAQQPRQAVTDIVGRILELIRRKGYVVASPQALWGAAQDALAPVPQAPLPGGPQCLLIGSSLGLPAFGQLAKDEEQVLHKVVGLIKAAVAGVQAGERVRTAALGYAQAALPQGEELAVIHRNLLL